MTNAVKYFNKSVEDSKKVVEITNDHIDKSRENVNKMNKVNKRFYVLKYLFY